MTEDLEISLVAPMHNEEGNAEPLYKAAKHALDNLARHYEIIFVKDGSRDKSHEIIKSLRYLCITETVSILL